MSIVSEDLVRKAEVAMLEARPGPQSVLEKRLIATRQHLVECIQRWAWSGDASYLEEALVALGEAPVMK